MFKGMVTGFNSQQLAALASIFSRGQDLSLSIQTPAADGKWDGSSVVILGSGIDLTYFQPVVGKVVILFCIDSTADATVNTSNTGITFDGSNDLATFADAGDCIVVLGVSATRWAIIVNTGGVTFS